MRFTYESAEMLLGARTAQQHLAQKSSPAAVMKLMKAGMPGSKRCKRRRLIIIARDQAEIEAWGAAAPPPSGKGVRRTAAVVGGNNAAPRDDCGEVGRQGGAPLQAGSGRC